MNNQISANYFINDLKKQMEITLSGKVEIFSSFITDYVDSYKEEINKAININKNVNVSANAMNSIINDNYYNYIDDAKTLIEFWILRK